MSDHYADYRSTTVNVVQAPPPVTVTVPPAPPAALPASMVRTTAVWALRLGLLAAGIYTAI